MIKNNLTRSILQILILSIVVVFAQFVWEGHRGFNLADEGFLWYGVQRVMLGEVPIRDFMAYDPGRYYWSAALMSLWGDNGIIALRVTESIFQWIGLFVGLLLIARSEKKQSLIFLVLSAVTLTTWMFTGFKVFDISISILLVAAIAYLVQQPTYRRYFITGVCVGIAAIFGRNHGIYALAACTGVIVFLKIKRTAGPGLVKGVAILFCGITVGFSPILAMALLVPGFATSFLDTIRYLFETRSTNLPLPIPWPWIWLRMIDSSMPLFVVITGLLYRLFFIAIPYFGVRSSAWVIWQKFQYRPVSSTLVAASFLALPYAHYAFSRADIVHLALGIFPFLIGCLVILAAQRAKIKWPVTVLLCLASLCVTFNCHPGWQCRNDTQCINTEISGSRLKIDGFTANEISLIRRWVDQYSPDGQNFLFTPSWPGAYAILDRKSPIQDIYAITPRSPAFEQAEIDRIKAAKPSFAYVLDSPLDGREELRYRNTHPMTYQYILDNFDQISKLSGPDQQFRIAKRDVN